MKKMIFIFVALLILSINASAQENWSSFNSEMGKFSIDFYGDVSVSEKIKEKTTNYKAKFTSDGMSVMVSSAKHVKPLSVNDLNTSTNIFIKSVNGSLDSKEEIEEKGIKGIFAVMTFNEETVLLEYKVFVKGNHQYQIIAYADKKLYNHEIADRSFNSFKIID